MVNGAEDVFFDLLAKEPEVKIFLFMLPGADIDYSISQIARGAEISLSTANRLFPKLIDQGYIVKTRTVGKSILYQLNLTNKSVADLVIKYNQYIKNKLRFHMTKIEIEKPTIDRVPICNNRPYQQPLRCVIAHCA